MRIRKRYRSPLPPPDRSSHIPPSMAAAAAAAAEVAAPTVASAAGATGGCKGGEAMAAAGGRASGSRYGGGGGGGTGLHSNGRPTNPIPCPPFDAPPSGAAAERGDLPAGGAPLPATRDVLVYHDHGGQVPKQEQDGEIDGGDAHGCGGTAPAPKSLGAKASQGPVGHGGHRVPPRGSTAALAAAQVMVRWSGGEGKLPPNKRGRCLAARGRSWGLDEEEKEDENMVAERDHMEQRRPSNSRRRRTAASSTPTVAAPAGTVLLTSAGSTGNIGGAPTATGDGAGATGKCDDVGVKEEGGGDVVPAAAASTLGDGNRGSGNGKKRRSPAVLMEGSRCSRVNGRGWRCCQQTLVGYSLCEHHLGKGRLRSVSSVRCNGRARKKEDADGAALPPAPSLLQEQDQRLSGDGDDEEEEKPGKRKRNKIGMVKARSISSLLHQPAAHPTPATIPAPEPFTSPSPAPATCPVTAAAPPPYGTDTAVA